CRPAHGGVVRAPRPRAGAALRPGNQRHTPVAAPGVCVLPARGARQALAPPLPRLIPRSPRGGHGALQPGTAPPPPHGGPHAGGGPPPAPHGGRDGPGPPHPPPVRSWGAPARPPRPPPVPPPPP